MRNVKQMITLTELWFIYVQKDLSAYQRLKQKGFFFLFIRMSVEPRRRKGNLTRQRMMFPFSFGAIFTSTSGIYASHDQLPSVLTCFIVPSVHDLSGDFQVLTP